jgi:hypothetical protein
LQEATKANPYVYADDDPVNNVDPSGAVSATCVIEGKQNMQEKDKRNKRFPLSVFFYLIVSTFLLLGGINCLVRFLLGNKTFVNGAAGIGFFFLSIIFFSFYWSARNQSRKK